MFMYIQGCIYVYVYTGVYICLCIYRGVYDALDGQTNSELTN